MKSQLSAWIGRCAPGAAASLVSVSTSMSEMSRLIQPARGWLPQDAAIRDRRAGPRRDLRHRLGRSGHHLHVLGHPELRLRRDRRTSSPASTTSCTRSRTGPSPRPPSSSIVIAAPAHRRPALRRPLPPPAAVVTPDQGGGDHRPAGGHPVAGDADLRQPGHPAGARPGARARRGLPIPGRPGHARPDHRVHLRRRDRGGRAPSCCATPRSASRCGPWSTRRP